MDTRTKREMLVDSISNMVQVQIKLEKELNRNPDSKDIKAKLDAVKDCVKSLIHTLDIHFSY